MSDARFAILDAAIPSEKQAWIDRWTEWPEREVFAHPVYVDLFAMGPGRRLCAVWESGKFRVMYPLVLREIDRLALGAPHLPPVHDLTSPYGYGGAFCWGTGDQAAETDSFWRAFDEWAQRESVVSEFVRFSLFPEAMLAFPGESEHKSDNIVRSLDTSLDAMWMDFEHKVRKNVQRAQRESLEIVVDPSGERLGDFLEIYRSTMDRRGASGAYYFEAELFERLSNEMAGQFVYFHALRGGRVVSTELVLVSANNVYSFLGGTSSDAFECRPNDLLKYEIIRWALGHRKARFVMGGGYEPNDGIFRYKKAFAPRGIVPFRVGHRILQPDLYAGLVTSRSEAAAPEGRTWNPRPGFFPAYRS